MRRAPITLLALVAMVLSPATALAEPGDTPWLPQGSSRPTSVVSQQTVAIVFGAGADDSQLLTVNSRVADICFDPDVGGTGGAARIAVFRALTRPPSDTARITVPAPPSDGSDCEVIVKGRYWFEITTAAGAGELAIVTVTGR